MTECGSRRWRRSSRTLSSVTRGQSRWDCLASASVIWPSRQRSPRPMQLRRACAFRNRILGFINAPAIWQWVMLETLDEAIDAAPYEQRRNVLCSALEKIGYEVRRPEGSFYIFLKTPIADDIAFVKTACGRRRAGGARYGLWTLGLHPPVADHSAGAHRKIVRRLRARFPCLVPTPKIGQRRSATLDGGDNLYPRFGRQPD